MGNSERHVESVICIDNTDLRYMKKAFGQAPIAYVKMWWTHVGARARVNVCYKFIISFRTSTSETLYFVIY